MVGGFHYGLTFNIIIYLRQMVIFINVKSGFINQTNMVNYSVLKNNDICQRRRKYWEKQEHYILKPRLISSIFWFQKPPKISDRFQIVFRREFSKKLAFKDLKNNIWFTIKNFINLRLSNLMAVNLWKIN